VAGLDQIRPLSLRRRRLANDADGSASIEFALTSGVLFTLLFCFMEVCLVFYTYDLISEAAREGTRYAMYRGASCPNSTTPSCEVTASQVNTYVSGLAWPNLVGGTMTPATTYPSGNESVGSTVQVKVTYTFPIKMPFVPTRTITMASTSVMPILQ
jgi:Flp pilus assembly protein TadG